MKFTVSLTKYFTILQAIINNSQKILMSYLVGKMTWRAIEHGVPHKSSRKDHLQFMVSPELSWEVLKEHNHLLEFKL